MAPPRLMVSTSTSQRCVRRGCAALRGRSFDRALTDLLYTEVYSLVVASESPLPDMHAMVALSSTRQRDDLAATAVAVVTARAG
jgi:hypothetical protein